MSIFKSQQRDNRRFWAWLAGWFLGQKCRSYIQPPGGLYHKCNLRRGHAPRHTDGQLSWGYGDNWLEGN